MVAKKPVHERILARSHRTEEGCRIWDGAKNADNYGIIRDGLRVLQLVHRVMYEWAVGKIKPGMTLDHLCHNRSETCPGGIICEHRLCFEPSHLEQITRVENALRAHKRRWEHDDARERKIGRYAS